MSIILFRFYKRETVPERYTQPVNPAFFKIILSTADGMLLSKGNIVKNVTQDGYFLECLKANCKTKLMKAFFFEKPTFKSSEIKYYFSFAV